jgi:hypothetical protein
VSVAVPRQQPHWAEKLVEQPCRFQVPEQLPLASISSHSVQSGSPHPTGGDDATQKPLGPQRKPVGQPLTLGTAPGPVEVHLGEQTPLAESVPLKSPPTSVVQVSSAVHVEEKKEFSLVLQAARQAPLTQV